MKIEEQVLSIEEMKHLQKLGVDTSDASMAYYNISRDNQPDKWILGIANIKVASVMLSNGITEMEPTYTIGDLIEKLPIEINSFYRGIVIVRNYVGTGYLIDNLSPVSFSDLSLLESLYNLLCWVAENHKELLEVRNE